MSPTFPSLSRRIAERLLPEHRQELPVIGWRNWRLRRTVDGAVLQSLFGNDRWVVGATRARCRCTPPWLTDTHHPVPSVSCRCGIYAFSTPSEAVRLADRDAGVCCAGSAQLVAAGAIVAWGRVVQHGRQGWRAEYARPVALLDTGHPMLAEAATRYHLPLVSLRGLCLLPPRVR
jgi:hypothetical protein